MRKVAAYCRSAVEQKGSPSAVQSQARTIRRAAKLRGLKIQAIYTDTGVSGVTLERTALQRLIADCCAGKIETIIVRDLNRLSRDMGQLAELLRIFDKADVRVEDSSRSGRDGFDFLKLWATPIAELGATNSRNQRSARS